MPFEKAKRTLDKATPGIDDLKTLFAVIGDLHNNINGIENAVYKGAWSNARGIADLAHNRIDRLVDLSAISSDTAGILNAYLDDIYQAAEQEDKDRVLSLTDQFIVKFVGNAHPEMARYARAPNAVGIGRTVTE